MVFLMLFDVTVFLPYLRLSTLYVLLTSHDGRSGVLGMCQDVHVMKGEWSAWGGRGLQQHR